MIPRRHPDSSRSKSDELPQLDHPQRPRLATAARFWPLTDGSCGFHSGLSSVGSVSFWLSGPRAELPLEPTGLPRSRGHEFEEFLRHPGGRRSRVASTRSALGSLVRIHQLTEEPHQDCSGTTRAGGSVPNAWRPGQWPGRCHRLRRSSSTAGN